MATKKKAEADKVKTGRPTDYRPEYCVRVIELGREGMAKCEIAEAFDVARQTLENWSDEHPEFLDAFTRAMDYSQAFWERQARQGIQSMGFNGGLWGKYVSCRFPRDWRETTRTEVTGADGGALKTEEIGKGFTGLAGIIEKGRQVAAKGKK